MYCVLCTSILFFFQAEDGIRELVRSRGLGDVYKRQGQLGGWIRQIMVNVCLKQLADLKKLKLSSGYDEAVSYTHLTLPTSDLV